jgi:hypothetical protein
LHIIVFVTFFQNQRSIVSSYNHNNTLPMKPVPELSGSLQGSCLHRLSPSWYTSTVFLSAPPATMTHPPIDAHANPRRASYIGGSGSHRSSDPASVNASHDDKFVNVW